MMDTKHLFRVSLFPLLLLPVVTPAQSIPEPLGTYYATNHGSPYSYPTGINASIMLCGTTNPCTVIVPAGYGYEPVPGSNPDPGYAQPNSAGFGTPGSVPSNVTIIDQRGGGATTLQNNENYSYSNAATGSLLNCSHTSTVPSTNGNSVYCFDILQSPNAGGTNYNYNTSLLDLGYSTTNWQALQTTVFASTKGQAIASDFPLELRALISNP